MAPAKRKLTSTNKTPQKKTKVEEAEALGDAGFGDYWLVKRIHDERINKGKLEYLIEWEAKGYSKDWEPAENCTDSAIQAWEELKAARASAEKPESRDSRAKRRSKSSTFRPTKTVSRRASLHNRARRIIESSSPEPPSQPPSVPTTAQASAVVEESQGSTSDTSAHLLGPSPKVQIQARGSSFDPEEYERRSQLADAQQLWSSSQSSYVGKRDYRASGIVHDSEEEDQEASYVLTTQDTSGESTTEEQSASNSEGKSLLRKALENIADTYLQAIPTSTFSEQPTATSPTSIPETQANTVDQTQVTDSQTVVSQVEDSQSYHSLIEVSQIEDSQVDQEHSGEQTESLEIPETLEAAGSSSQLPSLQALQAERQPTTEAEEDAQPSLESENLPATGEQQSAQPFADFLSQPASQQAQAQAETQPTVEAEEEAEESLEPEEQAVIEEQQSARYSLQASPQLVLEEISNSPALFAEEQLVAQTPAEVPQASAQDLAPPAQDQCVVEGQDEAQEPPEALEASLPPTSPQPQEAQDQGAADAIETEAEEAAQDGESRDQGQSGVQDRLDTPDPFADATSKQGESTVIEQNQVADQEQLQPSEPVNEVALPEEQPEDRHQPSAQDSEDQTTILDSPVASQEVAAPVETTAQAHIVEPTAHTDIGPLPRDSTPEHVPSARVSVRSESSTSLRTDQVEEHLSESSQARERSNEDLLVAEQPLSLDQAKAPEETRPSVQNTARLESPVVGPQEVVANAAHPTKSPFGEQVQRRDFAPSTQKPPSSGSHPASLEQNAQIVPLDQDLSTQESFVGSVLSTIEIDEDKQRPGTPHSRHDSSQESPASSAHVTDSSPVPRPPPQSLGTLGSDIAYPPRPSLPSSSQGLRFVGMDDEQQKADIARRLAEAMEKRRRETDQGNVYTPSPRARPQSRLFASAGAGTRSPSTIPDRSPAPQAPVSLRTIAITNSTTAALDSGTSTDVPTQDDGESGGSDSNALPVPAIAASASTDEELSDAEDSLLNDDLQLLPEEYIVPLPIEGRQASMYADEIKNNRETLQALNKQSPEFDDIAKVEKILYRLHAIETHVDIINSESQQPTNSSQFKYQAQWTSDNSVKFRFLGVLLQQLQNLDLHIILVTEKDDNTLFNIIETYLRAIFVNYKFPTRGRQAALAAVQGRLTVTVLSNESTSIVSPPDIIVCLDGYQEAARIRQKNWAANRDRSLVPVLHLVIPKTVDHIQRYVSASLGLRERLHTIFASLSQFQGEFGQAMDHQHSLRSHEAAAEVAAYIQNGGRDGWPLPSIGSIKDVIEFNEQSQKATSSPAVGKRPLEDEELDPAKRMRMTPRPEPTSSNVNEMTRVSDSMPDTAVDANGTVEDLALALATERGKRKALEQRFREHTKSWEAQQTRHEDHSRDYSRLKREFETLKSQLEAKDKLITTLRERIDAKTATVQEAQAKFKANQDMLLLSPDEKVAEITRLRKEVSDTKDAEQRAIKSKEASDSLQEYTKEQYRTIQDTVLELRQENEDLTARLAVAERKASDQVASLAKMHYERVDAVANARADAAEAKVAMLLKQLATVEDERNRLKSSRGVGIGTRAQSVGPKTPRPGSRAASPMANNRDRVANLRNG